MREYALANSLYWALAEGHACEQSARRNAMDVSLLFSFYILLYMASLFQTKDLSVFTFVFLELNFLLFT